MKGHAIIRLIRALPRGPTLVLRYYSTYDCLIPQNGPKLAAGVVGPRTVWVYNRRLVTIVKGSLGVLCSGKSIVGQDNG
jgi:hypothetical protein